MGSFYKLATYAVASLTLAGCSASQKQYDQGYKHGAARVCADIDDAIVSLEAPLNPGNGNPSTLPEPARSQFLKLRELEARVNTLCDQFFEAGN